MQMANQSFVNPRNLCRQVTNSSCTKLVPDFSHEGQRIQVGSSFRYPTCGLWLTMMATICGSSTVMMRVPARTIGD